MTPLETSVLVAYFFVLSILGIYGWHRYYLVYQYMKHKDRVPGPPPAMPDPPVVTVQLPIYNELYVVDRLIDAVCALDYPPDRLEIQVLDDSTDETRGIVDLAVRRQAARGFDITCVRRSDRVGFKAGALSHGLRSARGEFVAIFDADFVPPRDFLMKTVPYFQDPQVAVVQARWGHLNQDYSLLTKIQAILLDGHFVLEHGARNRSGCFFNFNGTAGVWRRAGDRGFRRLAARHPHRGPGPQLSRAAARLAVRVPAGPGHARRSSGRDERVQVPAASLGQGLDPDVPQAAADHSAVGPAAAASRPRRSFISRRTSTTC